MRSATFGQIPNISKTFTKEESLACFEKICLVRNFEWNVKKAYDLGLMKFPVYLSLGEESISAALSVAYKRPHIFAQHRCHDLYLSYGGNIGGLIDELLGRDSGCARGMGGSASIHSPTIGMFGHDGLMGSQIPIAVGYALGTGNRVLAVMGDASAEEDYVLAAMGYAATKKLPILFVCADNGLSILTKVEVRRNWKMAEVAAALGMKAVEITDDPWLIMHHARELPNSLPAFMNIHTVRHLWHAGTGKDSEPEWDRFAMIKEELTSLGLQPEIESIEEQTAQKINSLWEQRLNAK